MLTPWLAPIYLLALVGAIALADAGGTAIARRSHNATMARLARLELASGMGLFLAKDWLETRTPRGQNLEFNMIARPRCYGCGKSYTAHGQSKILCPDCRRLAHG